MSQSLSSKPSRCTRAWPCWQVCPIAGAFACTLLDRTSRRALPLNKSSALPKAAQHLSTFQPSHLLVRLRLVFQREHGHLQALEVDEASVAVQIDWGLPGAVLKPLLDVSHDLYFDSIDQQGSEV